MQINILDVLVSIILIYFGVLYLGTFGYILVIYAGEYLNGVLSIEILLKNIDVKFNYIKWLFIPLILGFLGLFICNHIAFDSQIITLIIQIVIFFFFFLPFLRIKNKA